MVRHANLPIDRHDLGTGDKVQYSVGYDATTQSIEKIDAQIGSMDLVSNSTHDRIRMGDRKLDAAHSIAIDLLRDPELLREDAVSSRALQDRTHEQRLEAIEAAASGLL